MDDFFSYVKDNSMFVEYENLIENNITIEECLELKDKLEQLTTSISKTTQTYSFYKSMLEDVLLMISNLELDVPDITKNCETNMQQDEDYFQWYFREISNKLTEQQLNDLNIKQNKNCAITGKPFVFIPTDPYAPYLKINTNSPWLNKYELVLWVFRQ